MTRTFYTMRCLCGLRAILHFTGPCMTGAKLTCAKARELHPYAIAKADAFVSLLRRAS